QLLAAESPDPSNDIPSMQIGRLMGVVLKEPFAVPKKLTHPSSHSGAFRTWDLVDEMTFNKSSKLDLWQYDVLKHIAKENDQLVVYNLAMDAHHERGFFGYLARSTANYICGDPKIRNKIKKAVDAAKQSGINIKVT